MPQPKPTLEDFVAEMKADVDRFATNWRKNHAATPEEWPMQMDGGDWYDQFLMFESSGDKS